MQFHLEETMSGITVSALIIYPIKSCQGIEVSSVKIGATGMVSDREFMLVDEGGVFVGQKKHPKLATVRVRLEGDIAVGSPLMRSPVSFDPNRTLAYSLKVVVQGSATLVHQVFGRGIHQWFSQLLGRSVRLVKRHPNPRDGMGNDLSRRSRSKLGEAQLAFQDGSPLLICSQTSLAEFNESRTSLIGMDRFRPNIVLSGLEDPWVEDRLHVINFGEGMEALSFVGMRKCQRCAVIETDKLTGERQAGALKALAQIRPDKRPNFGLYADHFNSGFLRVGMPVSWVSSHVRELTT